MSIRGLLIQWASAKKIQLNVFVKNKAGLIIISLEISSFSPLYSWKIAELVSSNNHSLTEVHIIKFWRENNIIGYVYLVFLAEYNTGADPGRGAPGARPLINDWCDWLDDKYVILTLCSFNSSLHYYEYSYMSLLSRSGSCTNGIGIFSCNSNNLWLLFFILKSQQGPTSWVKYHTSLYVPSMWCIMPHMVQF
jgi:hypothetical protein